jgi:hypothetical protein
MKRIVTYITLILILFLVFSCAKKEKKPAVHGDVLEVYLQFSPSTDPGEYAYLLDELPVSVDALCSLVKAQLIDPVDVGQFGAVLPGNRTYEDHDFPTVQDMLKGLLQRDSGGLTLNRQPENRLVAACYQHALLLASILRYQGVPTRIRTGFARYYEKQTGIRFDHAVCEVWDKVKNRWMLVDPDRQKVDFSKSQFEFGSETWLCSRNNTIDPEKYTSSAGKGDQAILHVFIQDLSCVLLEEKSYWKEPPIARRTIHRIDEIEPEQLEVLDDIAGLMSNPDIHLEKLSRLYQEHEYLQCCKQSPEHRHEISAVFPRHE